MCSPSATSSTQSSPTLPSLTSAQASEIRIARVEARVERLLGGVVQSHFMLASRVNQSLAIVDWQSKELALLREENNRLKQTNETLTSTVKLIGQACLNLCRAHLKRPRSDELEVEPEDPSSKKLKSDALRYPEQDPQLSPSST